MPRSLLSLAFLALAGCAPNPAWLPPARAPAYPAQEQDMLPQHDPAYWRGARSGLSIQQRELLFGRDDPEVKRYYERQLRDLIADPRSR